MPSYTYERISTGEIFTEFLPMSRMNEPCEQDPDVKLTVMAPRVMAAGFRSIHRKGDQFRQAVIEPKIKALNPRGIKSGA